MHVLYVLSCSSCWSVNITITKITITIYKCHTLFVNVARTLYKCHQSFINVAHVLYFGTNSAPYLRGMSQLLAITKKAFHHVRFNEAFWEDLKWWHAFLDPWNGVSMLFEVQAQNPQIEIWSDASGGWGVWQFGMVSGFIFSGLTFQILLIPW